MQSHSVQGAHQQSKIIFIVGPSAVGKSTAGILLAKALNAEIVSCDAMQVYREVNIASDKPSLQVRSQIKHHALDLVSVTENFNVAQYAKEALKAISDIQARGKLPIVLGGSGMYMGILLDGIFDGNLTDAPLRETLEREAKQLGGLAMHERLHILDPKAAHVIHPNNLKRVIRALEVATLSGKPFSELQQQRSGLWSQYDIKVIGLNRPREILYERVDARVDHMFEAGLVEEIRAIHALDLSPTAQGLIGVNQVGGFLKGQYDLERAKYLMKRDTRHYVKRQLTWFNREERLQWIDIGLKDASSAVVKQITSLC